MNSKEERMLTRTLIGGAAALACLTPAAAMAQSGDPYFDRDEYAAIGHRVGEILAGAMNAGEAAVGAARDSWYRGRGYADDTVARDDYGYGPAGAAVRQCTDAARYSASRHGRARVSDISDIDEIDGGFRVRGAISLADGWNNDYGRFDCRVRYGRIERLRIRDLD
jgi:hypothetical protein